MAVLSSREQLKPIEIVQILLEVDAPKYPDLALRIAIRTNQPQRHLLLSLSVPLLPLQQ